MKKFERKTKDEKRRVLLNRKYEAKQARIVKYGSDSVAVVAKDVNRRFIAAFLALVFVLTTLVIGVNFVTKAEMTDDGFNMLEKSESGMILRKGLKFNDNGTPDDKSDDTYDLRLEAYATEPTATKTYDTNTPLDVVLVMDQSGSMDTKDVLTGGHEPIENKSSYTISEAEGKFYKVTDETGDHYYEVFSERSQNQEDYVVVKDNNGNAIVNWTAEDANNKKVALNQDLYLKNGNSYEVVHATQDPWYKNAGSNISPTSFDTGREWYYRTNYSMRNTYFYNTASDSERPSWRQVHMNYRGVLADGYYYYLWYYTENEPSVTIPTEYALTNGTNWGTAFNNAYRDGKVAFIPTVYSGGPNGSGRPDDRLYHAHYSALGLSNENYTGGKLYSRQNADSVYNRLYTTNEAGTAELQELAWPLTQTSSAANAGNPGSSTHEGEFYTAGYKLYYIDSNGDKQEIDNCTAVYGKNEVSYNGTLYELETMTRLDAEKLGATNLAQQIAGAVTEDANHRIAVVGFNNSGSVKSGLVQANTNDSSPDNDVNDAIDAALADLSASGTSSVAAGLTTAQSIFANNQLDPADSRKRIVVVFTDDDAVESAANTAAETLKNTYHASVYTIGYDKDGVSSAVENWLDHLSSNYYASTETNDGIDYYTGTTNKATILDAFEGIEIASPTTTATLRTANAVLKDIISNNFDTTNISTDVKVSTGTWPNGGELSWGNPSSTSLTATRNGNTISVPGFDYNGNYVAEGHNGQKIILTITGLKLKDKVKTGADKRVYTNEATSGIYKTGAEDLLMAKFLRPYVDDISNMAPAGGTGVMDNGVVVNKYLTPNGNGKYDLTLEAYTTETNQTKVEKVPTDFVIVVDQSGSMSTRDMPTGYTAVSGGKTIEEVAAGSYYIQAADGNFYRVYGTRDYLYRYYPSNYWFTGDIVDRLGTNLGWFMRDTETSTTFQNQFYFREVADGEPYYRPITTTIQGVIGTYYMKFHYDSILTGQRVDFNREDTTFSSNGNSPWYHNLLNGNVMRSGAVWWAADAATQALYPDDLAYTYSELATIRTGMYVNYPMYERKVGYTELRYRDINGVEHTLAATNGQSEWEFCNASGQALTSADGTTRPTYTGLYQASGTKTRLEALKEALSEFSQAVADESDSDGKVDNRIAIVGFSSEASDTSYSNTEILTGENLTVSNNNGRQMRSANQSDYATALVSATAPDSTDPGTVNNKINAAINALTANGGTQPEYGLQMANSILSNRSVTQYEIKYGSRAGQKVDRNTIVIFFTDGQPGNYAFSDQYTEANQVVEAALPIKQSGTTVFSIGVFGESDGNPLTYTHESARTVDPNWEYLGGWVENYQSGNTYYALRRQWRPGADGYTDVANDTIYDYMSVTSSNYPTAADFIAPGWLSGNYNGTYTQATDGVRNGSAETTVNNHYRMASNQDTLIAAFAQAATMMNDTISENVRLDTSAILRDIMKNGSFKTSDSTIVSTSTVDGAMDKNGVVTFADESNPITLSQTPTYADGVLTSVDIKGFDYLANYINYGTGTGVDDIHYHEGKKLVVTITDVYPDGVDSAPSGDTLVYSNQVQNNNASSALYGVNDGNETKVQTFPEPAITRHKYTLDVGDANPAATFDVKAGIVNSGGNYVNLDNADVQDDLKDVMIVLPDGSRYNYLAVGPQVYEGMANGESFYFENVPQGYSIKTEVTATDDAYIYSIRYDNTGTAEEMTKGTAKTHTFDYDNHVINITSVRSTKDVTIWEQTIGSYANVDEVFQEEIIMEIPLANGETAPATYTFPTTYNGESGYTATFTTSSQADGKAVATLTSIQKGQDAAPVSDGKLSMKHDDTVTFTVPTGNTVKVTETTTNDYDVSYYHGQDDVAPSDITLTLSDGTPLDETVTLKPVDGISASAQNLNFSDGRISGSNDIDLAPYQEATFTSNEDIGYPVLTIAGTRYTFMPEEQQNGSFLYSAIIKPSPMTPPASVTVDKTDMDILIVNEKGDIPVEGIMDSSSHNWIIYILAALAGLAAIGGGIFLWKKKDEFVEE